MIAIRRIAAKGQIAAHNGLRPRKLRHLLGKIIGKRLVVDAVVDNGGAVAQIIVNRRFNKAIACFTHILVSFHILLFAA